MSIAGKLLYLDETKALLRDAINRAGGGITSETPFRSYAVELDYALWVARGGMRSLFDNGETGTLASGLPYFVDVDGETEATWGDPVGLVKDSSGNGNDFTQPTITARPILGRVPRGGRRNQLGYTEDGTQWIPVEGETITTPGVIAPDGSNTAVRIEGVSGIGRVAIPVEVPYSELGGEYTCSIWVRSPNSAEYGIYFAGSIPIAQEAPSEWQEVVETKVWSSGLNSSVFQVRSLTPGGIIEVWRPQSEEGPTATPYQRVTSRYDITEEGAPEVHYLEFDGTDDLISTELPAISGGTLVLATDKGIWIDDDFSFGGGSFDIGPETYSGGPAGLLGIIGNPLVGGALVIDRQLTTAERTQVVAYMQSIGSPGVIELGPELLVNGDFSDGFDGWLVTGPGSERWSVSDGVATIAVGTTASAYLWQANVTEGGRPHLITVDIVSSNGVGNIRAGGATDNQHYFQLAGHPVGEMSAAFVSGGAAADTFQVNAAAATQASISSISFREVIFP